MEFYTRWELEHMTIEDLRVVTNRVYARVNKRIQTARKKGASEYDISLGLGLETKTTKKGVKVKGYTEIRKEAAVKKFEAMDKGKLTQHISTLMELQTGAGSKEKVNVKKGYAVDYISKLIGMTQNHVGIHGKAVINANDIDDIMERLNILRDYTYFSDEYLYESNGQFYINSRSGAYSAVDSSAGLVELLDNIIKYYDDKVKKDIIPKSGKDTSNTLDIKSIGLFNNFKL